MGKHRIKPNYRRRVLRLLDSSLAKASVSSLVNREPDAPHDSVILPATRGYYTCGSSRKRVYSQYSHRCLFVAVLRLRAPP
jgi:hypothetical protein